MVLHAINLGVLTLLFFIIGMIKPKWALFFMEKPTRWIVTMVSTVFFMIVMTMYGEGIRQAKLEKKHKRETPAAASVAPVPTPEADSAPVPVPLEPAKEAAKNAKEAAKK